MASSSKATTPEGDISDCRLLHEHSGPLENIKHKSISSTTFSQSTRRESTHHMTGVHPLLRESVYLMDPITNTLIRRNALIEEAAETGTLLLFGSGAGSVVRFLGFESDPLWQPNGDCAIRMGKQDFYLDSQVIFNTNSEHLYSYLKVYTHEGTTHYRLDLPLPGYEERRIRNNSLAIRNFLAALACKPIVGATLASALKELQAMAEHLLGFDTDPERAVRFVQDYVEALKLDDCRCRPADIVQLLQWSESTKWEKVYIETFVHCVGMLNCGLVDQTSLDHVSTQTRTLLEQSCSKMHYDRTGMEELLAKFSVEWGFLSQYRYQSAIKESMSLFQQFLTQYYTAVYGKWPPESHDSSGHWLTRPISQRLQDDFGSLYDLLVDESMRWGHIRDEDGNEVEGAYFLNKQGKRVPMVDGTNFWATTFPFETFMVQWNKLHDFKTMPHPFCLQPKFGCTKFQDLAVYQSSLIAALRESFDKQPSLNDAYLQGTNKEARLTPFCKAFINHEASTHIDGVDTHDARLGRWVIVHSMMQLLSRVAVEVQGLRWRQGVGYFLSANLQGCPPWTEEKMPENMRQASHLEAWAYIYGESVVQRSTKMAPDMQNAPRTPRFKIEWLDDGRCKLLDPEGCVVFA